ncbi:uncharacterized protein LOC120668652 isoform X1 [Panicum virgatum]|uniref:uncharacterized protein LOC120668652 isoform X1 n=1 Tax=Panicum virgatum TaxID=38727 RepID=UPI0019D5FDF5|nr:uncharacterized protein LOC120668652 isoform X1 [Panicum virgatum]
MGAAGLPALLYPNPPLFFLSAALRSAPMGAAGLPALGWAKQFGHSADIKIFGSDMAVHGTHKAFSFRCFAANGRAFGADSTNKRKIKSKRRPKDVAVEPSKVISGNPKNMDQCKLTSIFS